MQGTSVVSLTGTILLTIFTVLHMTTKVSPIYMNSQPSAWRAQSFSSWLQSLSRHPQSLTWPLLTTAMTITVSSITFTLTAPNATTAVPFMTFIVCNMTAEVSLITILSVSHGNNNTSHYIHSPWHNLPHEHWSPSHGLHGPTYQWPSPSRDNYSP